MAAQTHRRYDLSDSTGEKPERYLSDHSGYQAIVSGHTGALGRVAKDNRQFINAVSPTDNRARYQPGHLAENIFLRLKQ